MSYTTLVKLYKFCDMPIKPYTQAVSPMHRKKKLTWVRG